MSLFNRLILLKKDLFGRCLNERTAVVRGSESVGPLAYLQTLAEKSVAWHPL
jgi:hypothetical protein